MRTRDIDWFALINNQPCHFASNGGILPYQMRDRKSLVDLQQKVAKLEYLPNQDIQVNRNYVEERLGRSDNIEEFQLRLQNYISSFVDFSKKGFVSYDRLNPNDPNDSRYIWIARGRTVVDNNRQINELLYNRGITYRQNEDGIIDFGEMNSTEIEDENED